jgi:hypothetical protein
LTTHCSSAPDTVSREVQGEEFMEIDLPEVVAEVRAAFDRYE